MKRLLLFGLSLVFCLSFTSASAQAPPQPPNILGQTVVTCFSGYTNTGVVKDDYVAGIINVHQPVGPSINWMPPMYHGPSTSPWKASNLGQVFGIAIDKRNNIYLTATSSYGVQNPATNPYMYGPAGSGGVYQLDGVSGAINSNFITTTNYNTFSPNPASAIGTKTIPNGDANNHPGLGNICYDRTHDKLFVTNFEDGIIYRIDPLTQKIDAIYDPVVAANPGGTNNPAMVADNGTSNGFAPRGDRLWGIAYNPLDNRVYYSVWVEDQSAYTATTYNVIRSIGLTASGAFNPPTDDRFEIKVPSFVDPVNTSTIYDFSQPVSDIAFSSTGKMLLAERCMYGDNGPSAHNGSVLEYTGVSLAWVPSTATFFTGNGISFSNSAGGIDYGYKGFDSVKRENTGCDSVVWQTGDYLQYDPAFGGMIYGMQRTPSSGNTTATVGSTGYFVDFNGVPGTQDKTQIGDVEVYRLPCGQQVQQNHCAEKRVKTQFIGNAGTKDCCWKITLQNQASNFWTSFSATVVTAGTTLMGALGPNGWNVTNDGTTAVWTPFGTYIPTGTTDSLVICLFSTSTPPQTVILTWHGADGTVCYDTLRSDCSQQQPPMPHCADIIRPKMLCTSSTSNGNTYTMTFNVINNSLFSATPWNLPAYHLHIIPATPGVTVVSDSIPFSPPLGYGIISPTITVTLSGPGMVPGHTFCLYFQLHGQHYTDSAGHFVDKWCCPPDSVCFTVPPCKDCCDGFKKVIDINKNQTDGTTGITTLGGAITAGPKPIIKASATIISADIKRFGQKCGPTAWLPVSGEIAGTPGPFGGLPVLTSPAPFSSTPPAPYREVLWGTVPSGVNMVGAPLALQFQFPAPPSPIAGCYDSLRFCVRYTFTDTSCVTCDTVICYQIRRVGSVVHGNGTDVGVGTGFGKITMSNATAGKLVVTVPAPTPDFNQEDSYHIVKIVLTPTFGARLITLTPGTVQDGIGTSKVTINQGGSQTFDLTYDNFAQLRSISNDLALWYLRDANPRDTLIGHETVIARTPNGSGGDVIGKDDQSLKPVNVRTFAVYFRNSNKSTQPISALDLSVSGGAKILAVGPGRDSSRVHMEPVPFDSIAGSASYGWQIVQRPANSAARIPVGATVRPVYLTIAGGTDKTVLVHYTTYDSVDAVVTDDTVTLDAPVSSVKKHDDPNSAMSLDAVYPNPASNSTTIQFSLSHELRATIEVRDELGHLVTTVMEGEQLGSGDHMVVLQTSTLPSGTYYVTLQTLEGTATKTLKIIR